MNFILKLLFLSITFNVLLSTTIPYPMMGGDWFYHTVTLPTQFSTGDWTSPKDKTSLLAVIIFILNKSLDQYWISQIITIILNSLYLIPSYFIARKMFNDQVAKISTLFMIFVPALIFNTIYTWPKNIAAGGILAMIYFLFFSDNKHRYIYAGIFGGLAFLFHNYTIFYIIITFIVLLWKKVSFKNIVIFAIPISVMASLHYLWVYISYGTIPPNGYLYIIFATKGYYQALNRDPEIFTDFFATSPFELIFIRIITILTTLTPAPLLGVQFPTYNPLYYYVKSYAGGLSTLMYVFLLFHLKKLYSNKIIFIYLLIPFLIGVIIWGYRDWGLVSQNLQPTVPLIIMIGINSAYKNKKLLVLLFIGAIIEMYVLYVFMNMAYVKEGGIQPTIDALHSINQTYDLKSLYYLVR